MCGRYAASRNPDELVEEFEIEPEADDRGAAGDGTGSRGADGDAGPGVPAGGLEARYNVAPTSVAPVVLERLRPVPVDERDDPPAGTDPDADPDPDDDAGTAAGEPTRAVRLLRGLTWGLVPSWAKDRAIGNRMINARAEGLLEKPAYRRAALSRRCLVPADGWYEWQASPTERDPKGKPRKQPFYLHPADGRPIAMAGVYEFWRDPAVDPDDPSGWLTSYAVITTEAEPGLDVVHDRMPLILPRDRWATWLDPAERDADTVRALLARPEPGRFLATAVSTLVNSVRNEGPRPLEPLPMDRLRGVVDPATGELIGAGAEPLF